MAKISFLKKKKKKGMIKDGNLEHQVGKKIKRQRVNKYNRFSFSSWVF